MDLAAHSGFWTRERYRLSAQVLGSVTEIENISFLFYISHYRLPSANSHPIILNLSPRLSSLHERQQLETLAEQTFSLALLAFSLAISSIGPWISSRPFTSTLCNSTTSPKTARTCPSLCLLPVMKFKVVGRYCCLDMFACYSNIYKEWVECASMDLDKPKWERSGLRI